MTSHRGNLMLSWLRQRVLLVMVLTWVEEVQLAAAEAVVPRVAVVRVAVVRVAVVKVVMTKVVMTKVVMTKVVMITVTQWIKSKTLLVVVKIKTSTFLVAVGQVIRSLLNNLRHNLHNNPDNLL